MERMLPILFLIIRPPIKPTEAHVMIKVVYIKGSANRRNTVDNTNRSDVPKTGPSQFTTALKLLGSKVYPNEKASRKHPMVARSFRTVVTLISLVTIINRSIFKINGLVT